MAFGSLLGGGAVGGAVVRLALDDTQLQASLGKAEAETKAATGSMAGGFSRFGALAKVGLLAAGTAAVSFAASAIKSFTDAEKVMAQTEAVIRSTGATAGFTAQEIVGIAESFQKTTPYADDMTQSMENVLLTFTSIKGDQFKEATGLILDMSTALGTDLQSSAIQVGKALNDPITGMTALRRVGVSFSASQVQQIQNFVEQNDLMSAQKLILDELNTEFGGSASAALDTYGGKWEQLMNKVDDFKERVGGVILPLTDVGAANEAVDQTVLGLTADLRTLGEKYLAGELPPALQETGRLFIGLALAEEAAAISAKGAGKEISNFAGMTADELDSWQKSSTEAMTFVEGAFSDLGDEAHLTGREILSAFDDALNAEREFAKNSHSFLVGVQQDLGPRMRQGAGEMVAALAEAGPEGAARMEALAAASDRMRDRIIRDWVASGSAARGYIGDLSSVDAYLAGLTDKPHTINIEVITKYIEIGKI